MKIEHPNQTGVYITIGLNSKTISIETVNPYKNERHFEQLGSSWKEARPGLNELLKHQHEFQHFSINYVCETLMTYENKTITIEEVKNGMSR